MHWLEGHPNLLSVEMNFGSGILLAVKVPS